MLCDSRDPGIVMLWLVAIALAALAAVVSLLTG